MEKILSWLENFKSFFSSEVAKISAAQAEVTKLTSDLAIERASVSTLTTKNAELTSALEKAQTEVNSSGAKIADLEAKLLAAKNEATEAIAAQSLDPSKLPEGTAPGNVSTQKQIDDIRAKIAQSQDPKEKTTLSRQIKELLSKKN